MTNQSTKTRYENDLTSGLQINDLEYLEMTGLNVMLAHDYYPEGHQGGVGIVQNGLRVATNGDIRLDPSPGQWSPIPKVGKRAVDRESSEISVRMEYPDEARDKRGFNPIDYPDLRFSYTLRIRPEGNAFRILVDLDAPLPPDWIGQVGFNLELYPAYLYGKTYATDSSFGVFPRQASGSKREKRHDLDQITPIASGRKLTIAPEVDRQRMSIEAIRGSDLQLIDGRSLHNNGWFVVRSLIENGSTIGAVEWLVTPHAIPDWQATPVIQVSQVGYHPKQKKVAVIELDKSAEPLETASLLRVSESGGFQTAWEANPIKWGRFLRFNYLQFDFTNIEHPGMYVIRYGANESAPFQISESVFSHGVWQPTIEYFLPVQMCHMRINENYRVWHGACHMDDASMAPTDFNHIDGYLQGPSTLTQFASGEHVPGLAVGGWHDAGDYDLRVESQANTVHGLALAYEEFKLDFDNTSIDQDAHVVELLRPDGKPDILQQIEHGCLSIVGGYHALGRLYRGIIEPTLRQYTHLGDAGTVTDNLIDSGDDRWVFTEENPRRELGVSASLAAASRVLAGFNDSLSADCLRIAKELYDSATEMNQIDRLEPALELYRATNDPIYRQFITESANLVSDKIATHAWIAARASLAIEDHEYTETVRSAAVKLRDEVDLAEKKTPYGLPYEPHIWGAGWGIQRFGVQQYWLHRTFPDIFPTHYMLHAVNFVLGCHPGSNTASFVSGVGAKSMIPGYGVNRADESYIPGGIGSGTALIRPDLPELLEWPYLWQQTEYCLGYPTSDYVFLIAAADCLLNTQS